MSSFIKQEFIKSEEQKVITKSTLYIYIEVKLIDTKREIIRNLKKTTVQYTDIISTSTEKKFVCRYAEMSIYRNNGEVRN